MFEELGKWLFRSPEFKVLLIGNDASGKTSLLYRLKLGEFITTIPTVGFNVETVEYPKGWQWTFWEVGGCDRIQPLLHHYLAPNTLVIFIHDCSDDWRSGVPDWLLRFLNEMPDHQARHFWVVFSKQDTSLSADTVPNLCKKYEECLVGFKRYIDYKILDHKLSAKTGEGTHEILQELYAKMSGSKIQHTKPRLMPAEKSKENIDDMSEDQLKALIEKEGSEDTIDTQTFWTSFLSADLRAWDHRSHLKAGYIIVLESAEKPESIFNTADTFITHLRRLKQAQPDRFRNTEHRTMTIFWLLQLQLAIWNYKISMELNQFPSPMDFQQVLLHTPALRNTRLWALYYSKDHIFNPQAKETWVIPDLQQLPILKPSPVSGSTRDASQEDPSRLLRFAFSVTQHIIASNLRRGEVIKEAFASFQTNTIRLRAKDTTIQPYSETQAYFWVQIVHAALKSLEIENSSPNSIDEKPALRILASEISYVTFAELFKISPTTWKDYYSDKTWGSISARIAFVPPDLKPLPNIIRVSEQTFKTGTV